MKMIGIIGGMGPIATSKLYLKIANHSDIERPEIVIDSVQMNLKFEKSIINGTVDIKKFREIINKSITRLNKIGVDIILIPCNTAHSVLNINSSVEPEILSIVKATAKKISKINPNSIAILGTKTTIDSNIYQSCFKEIGISTYIPDEQEQSIIESEINNILKGNSGPINPNKLKNMIENIFKKSDVILLACTELSELIETNDNIIDSLDCLIESAVNIIYN